MPERSAISAACNHADHWYLASLQVVSCRVQHVWGKVAVGMAAHGPSCCQVVLQLSGRRGTDLATVLVILRCTAVYKVIS
jgi:hypothetical protein